MSGLTNEQWQLIFKGVADGSYSVPDVLNMGEEDNERPNE
nr:MAG TPA: hypothetical protein [Caudoviricetes sp.]